jgi:predicted alpha/beta-hydrolase family hydrolase
VSPDAASGPDAGAARAALLLTPGASATRDHSQLVAIDRAVSALGVAVERIDLPRTSSAARHLRVIAEAAAALAERTRTWRRSRPPGR